MTPCRSFVSVLHRPGLLQNAKLLILRLHQMAHRMHVKKTRSNMRSLLAVVLFTVSGIGVWGSTLEKLTLDDMID